MLEKHSESSHLCGGGGGCCVIVGTGVQGGVINSGSPMDGAGGTTAAVVSGMTAGPTPTKTSAVSDAATVPADPAMGAPAAIAVKTLNGSNLVTISHIPAGGVPIVPKGNAPLSTTANTINPTYLPSLHNVVASTVIAPQSSPSSVPTVTLVRPPMQTPPVSSQGAVIPTSTVASVTSTQGPGPVINAFESPKTIIQTTAPLSTVSAVPTVATVAVKSPTVLQNVGAVLHHRSARVRCGADHRCSGAGPTDRTASTQRSQRPEHSTTTRYQQHWCCLLVFLLKN